MPFPPDNTDRFFADFLCATKLLDFSFQFHDLRPHFFNDLKSRLVLNALIPLFWNDSSTSLKQAPLRVRGDAARSRAFRFALLFRDNQPLDDFSRSARDVAHLLLAREVADPLLQRHRLQADPIGRNGYAAFDERNQPREENRHQVLSSE